MEGGARRGRPGYDQQTVLRRAIEVFNRQGYDGTSMGDLARELGVGKSALYHHVPGKEALLAQALDEALDGLTAVLDRPTGASAYERLRAAVRDSVRVLVEHLPAVTLLLSDGANSAGGDPFEQAERARQLGVPVYTIALGTAGGVLRQPNAFGGTRIQPVPPDPDSLARIAETSNGRFFQAPTSENLTAVYDSLGSRIGFRFEHREVTVAFTAAGLLLLAAAGALRLRRGARLP